MVNIGRDVNIFDNKNRVEGLYPRKIFLKQNWIWTYTQIFKSNVLAAIFYERVISAYANKKDWEYPEHIRSELTSKGMKDRIMVDSCSYRVIID